MKDKKKFYINGQWVNPIKARKNKTLRKIIRNLKI